MFIGLLTGIVSASNHTKFVSLSNQKCMTQHTIINFHLNEYTQGFHYYPFAVNQNRCVRSCNTLNDFSDKICVLNRTYDLNLSVLNMFTEGNESKILTKHASCKCKCKFDGRKCNSNHKWNNDKCLRV